jgi:high affinity Mn2+ porin
VCACIRSTSFRASSTADYQLITNPAYNADRGPVSIFLGRLHGEF